MPDIVWNVPLIHSGLGGIAATTRFVVFGDRDLDDFYDVFRCLNAQTGEVIWEVKRLAIGDLDYGNSPRATPLIVNGRVYCLSAFGHLLCISLTDGAVIWERNLQEEFPAEGELPWGYCGSPLVVDNKVIMNPGASEASLLALNATDGSVHWKAPGAGPSYGSLIVATVGRKKQVIGHDAVSLGGWDVKTGHRLWTLKPKISGDFNVPTPIVHGDRLLVVTENNGARRYSFSNDGRVAPAADAINRVLRPDMSTPVMVHDRFYCVNRFLYCLDVNDGLRELWRIRDKALADYGAIFASDDRVLIIGRGELLLMPADGSQQIISRQEVFADNLPVYSHPAIVGNRMYMRGESQLVCLAL